MTAPAPSKADQERAKWALLQAQIEQTRRLSRWETPKRSR
jgi:hypothetical protein